MAVATYADKTSAEQDYDAIRGIKHQGQIDHLAIAMVVKDEDGVLKIDRHDSTAKHLASDLLEDGDAGLVIVAVNPKGADIAALLANAASKVVQDDVSDQFGALQDAFEEADEADEAAPA